MSGGKDEPDLLVIGGGITGCAAARDAAGRGFRVTLVEKGDLGSGTTSRSSRMAHGGLRYLESFQLKLVFESLQERNQLFRTAKDFVARERFRLPVRSFARRMYVGAGLALYDLLSFSHDATRASDGFTYVDGLCQPERLSAALAAEAAGKGATIRTYCAVKSISADGAVTLDSGEILRPGRILLCAGPWTDRFLSDCGIPTRDPLLRPTRGSHMLMSVPVSEPHLLEASDGRVIFAVPSFGGTVVGTTDLDDDSDPSIVRPRDSEIEYLLREVHAWLPELGDSFRGAWTGIRPLVSSTASPGARSREELIIRHPDIRSMTIVLGGKLTTMRLMAERAVNAIERSLNREPKPWTRNAPIGPSLFPAATLADLLLRREYSGFGSDEAAMMNRARSFGAEKKWTDAEFARAMADFKKEAAESFGLSVQ